MDSSKTCEDDTIRDQMESGYVATRPRGTRARRTWKINVRNLVAEDMRALDGFFMATVQRGGVSFLYPNLLPNWSFEFSAPNGEDLVFGWTAEAIPQIAIGITTAAAEGVQAISFSTVAAQALPAGATVMAILASDSLIPCQTGEVYEIAAQMKAVQGTLAGGVLVPAVGINFFDQYGNPLSGAGFGAAFTVAAGWNSEFAQFTVPTGAVSFQFTLFVQLHNAGGSAITLDGSASVAFDAVGCALLTPLTPYGRMAGSSSLGCPVRFSKLPETSDIGMAGGVKRYGAAFELTEV